MNQKRTYKTNLCRHFITKGYCSLLDKCHFAHGKHELRNRDDPQPLNVPPSCKPISIYKTQLCKVILFSLSVFYEWILQKLKSLSFCAWSHRSKRYGNHDRKATRAEHIAGGTIFAFYNKKLGAGFSR